MSATVKCDRCGEEAEKYVNNGFSSLSFVRPKGTEKGEYETIHIDLCWEDTQKMIDLVLDWLKK